MTKDTGKVAPMAAVTVPPERIVAEARRWLGVPWRHQGRGREGLDCAGLVVRVARALDLGDHDHTGYGRHAEGQGFVAHFSDHLDPLAIPAARDGDVALFAERAYPCHCAILSTRHGRPHLIHAHAMRRAVIEEPFAGEWPDRLVRVFRFRQPGA